MTSIPQRFSVDFAFPVLFTRDLFSEENQVFIDVVTRLEPEKRHRVLCIIDENVAFAHPRLTEQIYSYFHDYHGLLELCGPPVLVPGGEGREDYCF